MSDPALSHGRPAEGVPDGERAPERPRRRASMFDDPMVRVLAFVAAGVVILYLAAVASALVVGVIGSPAARTAAERDLDSAESVVRGGDHSSKALGDYVNALTGVGQYGQAQDVIDSAPSTAKGTGTGELELAQVTLYWTQKNYDSAIKAANASMKAIMTAYQADLKKPGLNVSKSYGINANYYGILLLKGMSQQAAGDTQGALKSYDEYLAQNAMESNVLVFRGQVKLKLKDEAGAKADFKSALKYDPTNQLALDELKKIGAK